LLLQDTSAYCDELTSRGPGKAYCITADVGKVASVLELVSEIKKREGKLHVLVNNSGTNWNETIDTYPIDAFQKVMHVNVNAVFHLTQQCLPLLEEASRDIQPMSLTLKGSQASPPQPSLPGSD